MVDVLSGGHQPVFEYNAFGHVVFVMTGLDFTGAKEIERLSGAGFGVNRYAASCFMSTGGDGYDAVHRIVAEEEYRVALVLGRTVPDSVRTTEYLQAFAAEEFGYEKPLGGVIPPSREMISNEMMEAMGGIWYIAALHDPILDPKGRLRVLNINNRDGKPWVGAGEGHPERKWCDTGAFMFFDHTD